MQTLPREAARQQDPRVQAADVQLVLRVGLQHLVAAGIPWTMGLGRNQIELHPEFLRPVPSSIFERVLEG